MRDGNNNLEGGRLAMKLITPEELAELWSVPVSWLYERMQSTGSDHLPYYQLGEYRRLGLPIVEDWQMIRAAVPNVIKSA